MPELLAIEKRMVSGLQLFVVCLGAARPTVNTTDRAPVLKPPCCSDRMMSMCHECFLQSHVTSGGRCQGGAHSVLGSSRHFWVGLKESGS